MLEDVQGQALLGWVNAYRHTSQQTFVTQSGSDLLAMQWQEMPSLCHMDKTANGFTP